MNNKEEAKRILPPYPRTPHLLKTSNFNEDDILAENADVIFNSEEVWVEEKVDGASVGIYHDEHPLIRNRDHILNKGYDKKETPAKLQFRPLWNWYYKNKNKFKELQSWAGPVSVYGDWMLMQHGMYYDQLDDFLIAYDIYETENHQFYRTSTAREWLIRAGFNLPPLLHEGPLPSWDKVYELLDQKSAFSSSGKIEGIYIKVGIRWDNPFIGHRFKLINPDFQQGSLFSDTELKKNKLK